MDGLGFMEKRCLALCWVACWMSGKVILRDLRGPYFICRISLVYGQFCFLVTGLSNMK